MHIPLPGAPALGAVFAAGLLGLAACMPQATPEVSGRTLFAENCAVCHGDTGRGDGPAAAGLTPPPTDLTRLTATHGGSFPLARVMSYIDGYTRTDDTMPEFGDILTGPMVMVDTGDGILTPTPQPLLALAEYLESLQR